jgi:signal transduction histidine kinase
MLAGLFLLAIWLDRSQPARSPAETYGFLSAYLAFAVLMAVATWRNWWLDARLAAPAHFVDMAVFTLIVFSTNGYTSPFFLFFMLPLLSAAIRWGWRETLATAIALVVLYLTAGSLVAQTQTFELQRFIVRSGHLVILSALLIWFGIHQRLVGLSFRIDDPDAGLAGDGDALRLGLQEAMDATGAGSGMLLMRMSDAERFTGPRIVAGEIGGAAIERPLVRLASFGIPLLFDCARDRVLAVNSRRRRRFARATAVLDQAEAAELGLAQGLIAEVRTGMAEGWLVLQDVPDLSSDYIELARELGRAAGAILERSALFAATQEGAAARTRLALARDVHDSIVQFLAGAAIRIEAIARAARSGAQVDADLQELKRLIGDEQREIRGFVSALRRDRELGLAEAVEELRSLALRLSQQWSVDCQVNATGEMVPIPIRVHLDLQQLLREAVANAVRHGQANRIAVSLSVDSDQLQLEVTDNGTGFARVAGDDDGRPIQPWSLKERVDRAHGTLMLVSEPGRTSISISLPLAGAAA